MTEQGTITPSQICERLLQKGKAYNIEHNILPSVNAVADRLLARGTELTDAYVELHEKLGSHPSALEVFLDQLLSTAAFWNRERTREARSDRERLQIINAEIAKISASLYSLIEERNDLHNRSSFRSDTYYHPLDLIEKAAAKNYLYHCHIRDSLATLRGRYDLKYWPSIGDCLLVLSRDAATSKVSASDPLTEAATQGKRGSLADFFKTLFVTIEQNKRRNAGFLPDDFRLTDASLASLVTCALDLDPDEVVDSAYVKRLRQRERERVGTPA
ncbi:hypothetical protein [Azorhizobium caulinodans]|nr:hypothetical protein [Azorhizobium caulinodans]